MGVRENECQTNVTRIVITSGKILKISCVRCSSVKFEIHFLGLPWEFFFFFGVTTNDLLHL